MRGPRVREVLEQRGAIFFHELVAASGLLTTQVEQAGEERPAPELVQALVRKRLTPATQAHLGMAGVPAASAVPSRPPSRRRTRKAASKES
jgi:hypothetical protein